MWGDTHRGSLQIRRALAQSQSQPRMRYVPLLLLLVFPLLLLLLLLLLLVNFDYVVITRCTHTKPSTAMVAAAICRHCCCWCGPLLHAGQRQQSSPVISLDSSAYQREPREPQEAQRLSGAYAAFGARSNFDCMQAQLESGEFAVIDKLIYYSHD